MDADGNEITLNFVPEYWGMNATDNSVYLTKRYGVETTTTTGEGDDQVTTTTINRLPTYAQINLALTGGVADPWWNDPAHFRSYWASSPAYFDDIYPNVSDDVNDLDPSTKEVEYGISYLSYNSMAAQAKRTDDGGIGKQALAAVDGAFSNGVAAGNITLGETSVTHSEGFIYTRESTVSRYRINDIANSNPAAAVPSAVLVGKYVVEGATTGTTFYMDRNNGTNGIYYATEAAAKSALYTRQRLIFTNNTGTTRAPESRFTLMHPNKEARDAANVNLSGRLVTLQITEENLAGGAIYYYALNEDGSGRFVQIDEDNLAQVNAQLLQIGYLDMFYQGLAFFSVPIRHINWNNDWYSNGTYDWAAIESGALGLVRIHVYDATINGINCLGTAFRDPDQPIVPAKEETNQYIAMRLNILAWNQARTWSVDL